MKKWQTSFFSVRKSGVGTKCKGAKCLLSYLSTVTVNANRIFDQASPFRPVFQATKCTAFFLACFFVLAPQSSRAVDTITLSLPATLAEGSGGQATVTLSATRTQPVVVDLSTADERLSLPGSVTIPAGLTTANFGISYPDDPFIDDDSVPAVVSATATGFADGGDQISMIDNESHDLLILSGPITLTEGSLNGSAFFINTWGPVRTDLTVTIDNPDTTEVASPAVTTLMIPAGQSQTFGDYVVWPEDDSLKDGAQVVMITASAPGMNDALVDVTVRDNDPATFSWPAITGPVTAGAALAVNLRATTVDGDVVPLTGPITFTVTTGGQPSAVLPATLASLGTTGSTSFFLPKAGATVITATAGDVIGTSATFTVQAAAQSTFEWSPITTPMMPGVARTLTLAAKDAFGNTISSFNGTANLAAVTQTRADQVGTGDFYQSPVLDPALSRMRSQILIRSGSLAGAGRIYSLSLELLGVPTRPYDDLTIRLKHTSQFFAPNSWDGSGWTTVRQGAWLPSGAGWVTIPFQVPFEYDGTSNLYVDVSFANDSPGGHVFCRGTTVSGSFAYYGGTNNAGLGLPTTWSGNSVSASSDYRPNLKLGFESLIGVTPAVTTAFVNGVWSGDVTLTGTNSAHVVLRASSGGTLGQSDVFDLGYFPPAVPVLDAEPSITQGSSNTVSWSAVASAGGYYVEACADSSFSFNVTGSGWIAGTSYTFNGLSDGAIYFRVKARRAEDTSVESDWSEVIFSVQDATGPFFTVFGLPDGSGGTLFTSRNSVTLSGFTSDSSGLASLTVNGLAATIGVFGVWSRSIAMPPSGDLSVSIIAEDSLGNQSTSTLTIIRAADVDGDGLPDDWQQTNGLRGPGLNEADAGSNGDPDHDGITNLMEFARGLNPLVSDAGPLVISRTQRGFGPLIPFGTQIEYDRQIASLDLTYEIQETTDLQTWVPVLGADESASPNLDGTTEHVTVFKSDPAVIIIIGLPLPPSAPPLKFYRLVVTRLP